MEKLGKYIKKCWRPEQQDKDHGNNNTDDGPNGHQRNDPDGVLDEPELTPKPAVDLKDVFGLFVSEAQEVWQKNLNSLITRVRESQASIIGESFDAGSNVGNSAVGKKLFRHGASVDEIHQFFFKLDPKRCCLPMDQNKQSPVSFTATMRTIQNSQSSARPIGGPPSRQISSANEFMNDQEKELYKRVLQCAHYPVLCSPSSEPPVTPYSSSASRQIRSGSKSSSTPKDGACAMSPTDSISIDPDMMMKLLRESFGISQRIHERYYMEVKKNIPQRDSGKLLLHELQDRLYRLETNSDNYYRVNSFIDPDGYSKWRTKEIFNTKALIRRFWKKEMPRNLGMGVGQVNAHKEYLILQNRLFDYEMKNRRDLNSDSVDDHKLSAFPISTAARKLLKEFGLRYGVCSLFRQIAALVCMAEKFENTGWFIKFATRAVFQVDKILQNCDIMVEDEREMLEHALVILHDNIEYTFKKIRKLCPSKINFDTISWILEMLTAIIKIKEYIGILEENNTTIEALVQGYIEEAVCEGYGKCKDLAMIDNGSPYSSGVTAKTLITLLHDMRKEFKFYEELSKKCSDLNRYFDVTYVVANKLYGLCMKDIKELLVRRTQTIITSDINDKVLKLMYGLAQLDNEWVNYISPSDQKWRIYFMLEMHVIMTATSEFSSKQVRSFLAKDNWQTISFEQEETRQESQPTRERGNTLVSVGSLVQSERSAFARPVSKSNVRNGVSDSSRNLAEEISSSANAAKSNIVDDTAAGEPAIQPSSCGGSTEELDNSKALSNSKTVKIDTEIRNESGLRLKMDVGGDIESDNNIGTVRKRGTSSSESSADDEVFIKGEDHLKNSSVDRTDPCRTHVNDIESFIRELLDDLIIHVDRVEDFKIDFYIREILDDSLAAVRKELNRDCSDFRNCGSNIGDSITLLDNEDDRAGYDNTDYATEEQIEDFDSEIAKMLVNTEERTKNTCAYNDGVNCPDSCNCHSKNCPGISNCNTREKLVRASSAGDLGFRPVKIPELRKLLVVPTEKIAATQKSNVDLNHKRLAIPAKTEAETLIKSFSLPACDFVSLREKALRNDLPKSKSDQAMVDDYRADYTEDVLIKEAELEEVNDDVDISDCKAIDEIEQDSAKSPDDTVFIEGNEETKRAFEIAVEKRKTFLSQLSSNIQNKQQESEPKCDTDGLKDKEHVTVALPKEGRILVSSSLIDVLYMIVRISGFYSQLCDTLAPSKSRANVQPGNTKSQSEIIRENFALSLVMNIGDLLTTYGEALLALDLCGLEGDTIIEILGSELYNRLKNKQNDGLISGCRHDRNRRMSFRAAKEGSYSEFCPKLSKVIKYCIGEWESLSPEMCTRLNNTRSLIDMLHLIEDHAKQMCFGSSQENPIKWPGNRKEEGLCQALLICRKNLHLIWMSQARILAHQIAYMLEKIVGILLSLSLKWTVKAPYKEQMKPISVFLDHQMKMLHQNLRPVSVQAVVKALWNRVILILHDYAKELRVNRIDPKYNAERFIQLISVLLRHLVIDNETGDNLFNRCRAVLLRFRLHSLSWAKLELISDIARNLESDSVNLLRNLTAKEILLDVRASRLLPKVFSGEKLIDTLVNNEIWLREFSLSLGLKNDNDRLLAISVGKALFRSRMIVCVETPRQRDEPDVRRIISPIRKGGRSVRIGSKFISLSQEKYTNSEDSANSFEDDDEDDYDDDDERFHDTEDYLYTVSAKYCNESDLYIEIWRVFRQAGNTGTEFAHVIRDDVVSILEYRAFWKHDRYSKNILKSVAPKSRRGKAFSCPWF